MQLFFTAAPAKKNTMTEPKPSTSLKSKLPHAEFREFKGMGHFCSDDLHSSEFPELLDEVLK